MLWEPGGCFTEAKGSSSARLTCEGGRGPRARDRSRFTEITPTPTPHRFESHSSWF